MKNLNLQPYEREFLKILARQLKRNLEKKQASLDKKDETSKSRESD